MWRFLDDTGAIFGERTQPAAYDPRVRPWYRSATAANGFIVTSPYIIASTAEVGVTLAQPALGRSGVVGADMTLTAVSNYLADLKRSWTYPVALAVFDSEQQVVATSQPLPEGAGAQFVHVVDLHDAGITAAVTQFGTTGQAFNRATLQTPDGAMMASVQPVPFGIGEARHFFAIVAPLDAFVVPLLQIGRAHV